MYGLHCTDCVYGEFSYNEECGKYQGTCSRGYTLADPHVLEEPDMYFADSPEGLVPVIDPFGAEYLRTDNICQQFVRPTQGTVDEKAKRRGRR
ncbi:MAG: hypothetical protein J6D54_05845 [Olsenella sp.]|nr:hypothetical protein [Olsenella sp.]